MQGEDTPKPDERQDDYPCHCLECGKGLDFDLIWCSKCSPSDDPHPDRLSDMPAAKVETPTDNASLRGWLRFVGHNYLEFAQSEYRELTEHQIFDLMLEAARHNYHLRQEFKLAATHPRLTGGTVPELRMRLHKLIAEEARQVLIENTEIDRLATQDRACA